MKKIWGEKGIFRRFTSIQSAIQVSFGVLIVIALMIFLLIALNFTEKTVFDNTYEYTSRLINQVNYDIDSYIEYMENISSVFAENSDMEEYLFGKDSTKKERMEERTRLLSQFKTVKEGREDIANIGVLSLDGTYLINNDRATVNKYAHLESQKWYQEAMSSNDQIVLSSSHVQNVVKNSYQWVITLSRVLRDQKTNSKKGLFFIDLNYSAISDLCNNNKLGERGYIFIMDANGNLIYHPQQQLIYGGLKNEIINEILACKGSRLVKKVDGEEKVFTLSRSEKTGWIVVGTAYTSELFENSNQAKGIYAIAAMILLLLVVVISNRIAKNITRPVAALRDSMRKVEEGNFEPVSMQPVYNNEVGSLSKSFNAMTIRIQDLMQQIVKEQEELRNSEMRALQSQINPHFLYNTLDSIIWMAEGNKTEEVVTMTSALARLLRQAIGNEKEVIRISQEVEYIKSYLTIQKMRYKDKLEYEVRMAPEILNQKILKLVLQPIVENAIYHGLKYKDSLGMLSIRGYLEEGTIYIEIADDGIGMDEETLLHIFEKHKVNYRSNGVGVYNVERRLQLYYGSQYGIHYESRKNCGTTVTILIPADKEDKEDE